MKRQADPLRLPVLVTLPVLVELVELVEPVLPMGIVALSGALPMMQGASGESSQ